MIPVDQTEFGADSGNCFPAVVASLLELPLAEVPNVYRAHLGAPIDAWQAFARWAATRGWSVIEVLAEPSAGFAPAEGQWCWLCGKSPRHPEVDHAVVGRYQGGQYVIVHDPHPSRAGLHDLGVAGFLIPVDPRGKGAADGTV